MAVERKLGFSGAIAKRFQDSKITPLLALTGLLMGLFAIAVTPREEEPQINVTFANIFVPFPGASAVEVENLVAIPLEQVLSEIEGIKHTYSVSRPGIATLTIQYEVGEDRTAAIVRLYNERLLLTMLQRQGEMPASDLARRAGLSPQTVSVILRKMHSDGLIERGDPVRGRVGKPSVPMRLAADGALSYGVKIGRRTADLVVMNLHGDVHRQISLDYDYPLPDMVLEFLQELRINSR